MPLRSQMIQIINDFLVSPLPNNIPRFNGSRWLEKDAFSMFANLKHRALSNLKPPSQLDGYRYIAFTLNPDAEQLKQGRIT